MGILSAVFKAASKELRGGHKQLNWRVKELESQHMLYSSNEIKHLILQAKELKDTDALRTIFHYLKRHEGVIEKHGLGSYRRLFKMIRENVKISDLL